MTSITAPSQSNKSISKIGSDENRNQSLNKKQPSTAPSSFVASGAPVLVEPPSPRRFLENNQILPNDFAPSPHSVLCGRGKKCIESPGNQRLKVIMSMYLQRYSQANNKLEKSAIVSEIVDMIQDACPNGGAFIKFSKGRWYEISDNAAREKIGAMLRDRLHTQYSSSSKAKIAKKKAQQQQKQQNHQQAGASSSITAKNQQREKQQKTKKNQQDQTKTTITTTKRSTTRISICSSSVVSDDSSCSSSSSLPDDSCSIVSACSIFGEEEVILDEVSSSNYADTSSIYDQLLKSSIGEIEIIDGDDLDLPDPNDNEKGFSIDIFDDYMMKEQEQQQQAPNISSISFVEPLICFEGAVLAQSLMW